MKRFIITSPAGHVSGIEGLSAAQARKLREHGYTVLPA